MRNDEREMLFENLLGECAAIVSKVARAYTLTSEECQDLAQEILLQAWRSLSNFEERSSASTWFYRVALNTALSWQRKERHHRAHQLQAVTLEEFLPAACDTTHQVLQREAVEQLYCAIRQLPKVDAALILLYLDDLSYREIAAVLGISESNVGVKLNRVKKVLADLLKG